MKRFVLALLLLPALWVSVQAQNLTTADAVLNAYFKAIGGKKALLNMKDLTWKAASGTNGVTLPTIIQYKTPLKLVITTRTDKGQLVFKQVSDGKDMSITVGNSKVPLSRSAMDRMMFTSLLMPELHLADKGVKTAFDGRETVDGKEAYKLTHTMPDGSTWSTFYDIQTGLKVKLYVPGQTNPNPEVTRYGDYREVNGIKFPFILYPGTGTLKVESYQLNTGLSDAEFVIQ